jgi:hypothetical protein
MSPSGPEGRALDRGRDAGACGAPATADLHPDAGVRLEFRERCRGPARHRPWRRQRRTRCPRCRRSGRCGEANRSGVRSWRAQGRARRCSHAFGAARGEMRAAVLATQSHCESMARSRSSAMAMAGCPSGTWDGAATPAASAPGTEPPCRTRHPGHIVRREPPTPARTAPGQGRSHADPRRLT